MLDSPARIPRCQRFTNRLTATRAWLAVWRGVARSFATGIYTPPLHQFARPFQRICQSPASEQGVTVQQFEEARRYVLDRVIAGDLQVSQAAEILSISERHGWRLLAAYRARGAAALAHGNRRRRPHNAVPADVASAVVRLAATRYPGANHTHLAELLWEHEGLDVSSWTVRRILARVGIPSPRRRRPPEHRVRRERMPREGMLLQVDGSHHAWLEERGPRFALLLAVDDATGAAVHALFRPVEDARGYFLLLEEIVRRCGIPLALYSDRHGVFKASPDGRRGLKVSTQFARAMRELGITQIFARSPQAKGRVERAAGTFQDRLVTELRHASASTIPEAHAVLDRFLPRFNARFRVPAAQPVVAYRPLDPALPLASILSFRHPRTVARDNTVKYHWRTLQLLPGPERRSYAGTQVEVVERPDGELSVQHQGETIPSRPAPPRAGVLRAVRSELTQNPDHERIASGLGSGGALRRLPALLAAAAVDATRNGAAVRSGDQRQAAPGSDSSAARPLEGDPAGAAAGTVHAGDRQAARDLPRHRQQLRPRQRRPWTPQRCRGILRRPGRY